MAGLKSYDPNKPAISIDKGDWLDRMAKSGIPLTRALEYFRDNPEGEATETASLATEDLAPFYSSIINDGDVEDYVKEAVLMFTPIKGNRMKVRTMPDGTPNLKDLGVWYYNKLDQLERVEREIMRRDPSIGVEGLNKEIARKEFDYKLDEELLTSPERRKYYGYPDDPYHIEKLRERLSQTGKEIMDLRAKRDLKAIDVLDYNGMTHKDYIDKFGNILELEEEERTPFINRQIRNEYGKGMSDDEIRHLLQDAWNEGAGRSPNQLKSMYKDIFNGK